jgi:hypothetical protein
MTFCHARVSETKRGAIGHFNPFREYRLSEVSGLLASEPAFRSRIICDLGAGSGSGQQTRRPSFDILPRALPPSMIPSRLWLLLYHAVAQIFP